MKELGLRTELYRLATNEKIYAKFILPTLKSKGQIAEANNSEKQIKDFKIHQETQSMNAAAAVSARSAAKSTQRKGGATGDE